MDLKFQNQVKAAARLVRSRDYQAIGEYEFAKNKLVQKRLGPIPEASPVYVGRVLAELFREVIETNLKPSTPKNVDQSDWKAYIILSEYIMGGWTEAQIEEELSVSKNKFYDEYRRAIQVLALAIWDLEEVAREWPQTVMSNLPEKPPFSEYIPIEDADGADYASLIIQAFSKSRAWVFVLDGVAGVGKTSLAFEIAQRAFVRNLFNAIIWTSAKQEDFPVPGSEVRKNSYSPVTSLSSILDAIGTTLGMKKILGASSVTEKLDIVSKSLMSMNSLLIIDNLETLNPDVHTDIFDFLDEIKGPTKALITSRRHIFNGGKYFTITGMRENRAIQFMELEAKNLGFRNLERAETEAVFRTTLGNPLAMKLAVALMAKRGYRVQDAVGTGIEQEKLLHFMFEETYGKWLSDNDKRVLHVMPLFVEPVAMNAVVAAAGLGPIHVESSLRHLEETYFVIPISLSNVPEQERFEILPSVREFLRLQRLFDGFSIGADPITEFVARANEGLAQFYCKHLAAIDQIDGKIAFLTTDRRNLLSTMAWCYENQRWELLTGIVHEVGLSLGFMGFLDERELWATKAIEASKLSGDKEQAYWFTVRDIVWVLLTKGDITRATELIYDCLQAAKSNPGFERVEALCYGHLGRIARDNQRIDEAREYFEKSLEIWRRIKKTGWTAYPLQKLGLMYLRIDRLDDAQRYLEEALALQKEFKNKGEIAQTMSDLALTFAKKRLKAQAIQFSEDSISLARTMPQPTPSYAYALYRRAEIDYTFGLEEEATRNVRGALKLYTDLGAVSKINELKRFEESLKPKRKKSQ